jgi:tagatose-1,6-bisphosphate aldolase non-catalytic subunit AgaZ/GatZ
MGLNTTVLILNDALTQIEKDPEFGKKLVKVIRERALLEKIVDGRGRISSYVSAGNHMNAASVIETHHADMTAVVAIGGNYGTVLYQAHCREHHTKPAQWKLLEDAYNNSTKAEPKP